MSFSHHHFDRFDAFDPFFAACAPPPSCPISATSAHYYHLESSFPFPPLPFDPYTSDLDIFTPPRHFDYPPSHELLDLSSRISALEIGARRHFSPFDRKCTWKSEIKGDRKYKWFAESKSCGEKNYKYEAEIRSPSNDGFDRKYKWSADNDGCVKWTKEIKGKGCNEAVMHSYTCEESLSDYFKNHHKKEKKNCPYLEEERHHKKEKKHCPYLEEENHHKKEKKNCPYLEEHHHKKEKNHCCPYLEEHHHLKKEMKHCPYLEELHHKKEKNNCCPYLEEKKEKKEKNKHCPVRVVEIEDNTQATIAMRKAYNKGCMKGKRKEYSPQDAAMLIQENYRAHLARRSQVLRCLREMAVAKAKLKEIRSLFYNFSYRRRVACDSAERQRFSEKMIVLLLTVDALEGPDYMVRAAKKSMVEELEAMLEVVDPQPAGKLSLLRRRRFDLPEGPISPEMHSEVVRIVEEEEEEEAK